MLQSASKRRLAHLAVAVAGVLAFGWAAERFDYRVRQDFFVGFAGDQAAFERGMKACEETLKENPKHAEALVWHGAGRFFLSGRSFQSGDVNKGMELWQSGLKEMETAVSLEPDNLGVRIPRGAALIQASLSVPPAQAKAILETGVADFERVLELQRPYFAQIGTHPRGELLQGLAGGWYRLGDQEKARGYFERIVNALPGTEYEKRAKTWLETKTLENSQMRCVGCHVK